jgi:trans-aconitate 2-methyltransferase
MAPDDDRLSTRAGNHAPSTREWDAATYDRVATPQVRWVTGLLDHLVGDGVEVVLDAGCGTGRVTQAVLDRLPGTRAVALDGSRKMLEQARRRLAPAVAAGRVDFVHADLGRPLPLDHPVDAVVSTATFHWVPDHDALFANLAAVLRPGGQLVGQCGGAGNAASVVRAMAGLGETRHPWHFSTPEDTRRRLLAHGFTDVETWLHDEPTAFETRSALEEFLGTVVLGSHLERMAPGDRAPFVRAVADAMPEPVIDYVRLNILATRSTC